VIPGESAANMQDLVKTFILKEKGFLMRDILRDQILE